MDTEKGHLTRSIGLIPERMLSTPVSVIGAGAVGSCAVMALAKMGFHDLAVWDFDKVDEVNIGNQFYRFQDIGKYKVRALKELVIDFAAVPIADFSERFTGSDRKGVYIVAVDSMASRKEVWSWVRGLPGASWYLDPRMGAEMASLRVVGPNMPTTWEAYEKTLWEDSSIPNEPCTAKSTIYTAMNLGALCAQTVRDCLQDTAKKEYQWDIRGHILETY